MALDGLTPEFGAFFEELRPVMRAAKRGLPAATSIFKETVPLFGVIYPASRELGPIFSYFNAYADRHGELVREGRRPPPRPPTRASHYLRTLLPITSENLVGASHRAPTNRYNPYLRPGGLARLPERRPARVRLREHRRTRRRCRAIGSAPACREAGPWTFRGARASFPHVERDPP